MPRRGATTEGVRIRGRAEAATSAGDRFQLALLGGNHAPAVAGLRAPGTVPVEEGKRVSATAAQRPAPRVDGSQSEQPATANVVCPFSEPARGPQR